MQAVHLPLDMAEFSKYVLALRGREPHDRSLAQPLESAPGHRGQHVEVVQELFSGTLGVSRRRLLPLGACLEHEQRVREHERARLRAARSKGRHEIAHLPGRQLLAGNRLDEALASFPIGARQRDQALHRRVRSDLTAKHPSLDRFRKIADQGQSPAHPAHASIEAPREILQRQVEAQVQLAQPQPLLERRLLGGGPHQSAEQQRVGFFQVPAGGPDHVVPETPHRPDPLVPVHDDEALGLLRGHHHDRHLLTVLCQGSQQPPLPLRAPHPEVLVAKDQLVVLEVHDQVRLLDPHLYEKRPFEAMPSRGRRRGSQRTCRGPSTTCERTTSRAQAWSTLPVSSMATATCSPTASRATCQSIRRMGSVVSVGALASPSRTRRRRRRSSRS